MIPSISITQRFGENLNDYTQFGMKGHNGWDIGAPEGTPLLAVHDGQLKFYKDVDKNAKYKGYGMYMRLFFEEDGYTWEITYAHLLKYEGKERTVKKGEVIGYVDSTGFSTGHHLHFGVRKLLNGKVQDSKNGYGGSIDPAPFLKGDNMELVKDGNTVYLVGGINVKFKIGIGDISSLGLFGDEPVSVGSTSNIKESYTLASGFILNKK